MCATDIYVTSFSVFHTEVTVSIGLKNVLRMVRARQISLSFHPNTSKVENITLSPLSPSQLVRTGTIQWRTDLGTLEAPFTFQTIRYMNTLVILLGMLEALLNFQTICYMNTLVNLK